MCVVSIQIIEMLASALLHAQAGFGTEDAFCMLTTYAAVQVVLLALPGVDLDEVEREVSQQCAALPRSDVASQALSHSSIVSVSGGDYASGTNHVLPTYGYARMYSGVSLESFQKSMTVQTLSKEGLKGLGPTVAHMADLEGLTAHQRAVTMRLQALS